MRCNDCNRQFERQSGGQCDRQRNRQFERQSGGQCDCQCNRQMDALRAIDFAIQETVLYLDAYPHCEEALQYYHALLEQRNVLSSAYEKQCGPLTIYGNQSCNSWDWIRGPWPWQQEAN